MLNQTARLIRSVIAGAQDMVVSTVRPDGAPHSTMVSYASDGLKLYFGTSTRAQKARNLTDDNRVSIVITPPYKDWSDIRGLSIFGHALRVTDKDQVEKVSQLFSAKFPQIAQYVSPFKGALTLFEVEPELISVLDYHLGFGHTELVHVVDRQTGRLERVAA